jgi:hypothetical protein
MTRPLRTGETSLRDGGTFALHTRLVSSPALPLAAEARGSGSDTVRPIELGGLVRQSLKRV